MPAAGSERPSTSAWIWIYSRRISSTGNVLFGDGRDEEGQLREIFDVLGYPDERTWPWFSSTPFAIEWLPLDYR